MFEGTGQGRDCTLQESLDASGAFCIIALLKIIQHLQEEPGDLCMQRIAVDLLQVKFLDLAGDDPCQDLFPFVDIEQAVLDVGKFDQVGF